MVDENEQIRIYGYTGSGKSLSLYNMALKIALEKTGGDVEKAKEMIQIITPADMPQLKESSGKCMHSTWRFTDNKYLKDKSYIRFPASYKFPVIEPPKELKDWYEKKRSENSK